MENKNEKSNQRASSSSKKFNTDLFNRPFTGKDSNNPSLNCSVISQQSNQDNSFNKSVSSSITDSKKRKPFESLHFQGNEIDEASASQTQNSLPSAKRLNVSESMPKSNADTEITANQAKKKASRINVDQTANLNHTRLSESEKSCIMRTQSAIDKDTVNKALKYNKANDKENCPFG